MNAHVRSNATVDAGADGLSQAKNAPFAAIAPDIRISQPKIIGGVMLADIGLLLLAGVASHAFVGNGLSPWLVAALVVGLTAAVVILLQQFWAYTIPALSSDRRQSLLMLGANFAGFAALTTMLTVLGADMGAARGWLIGWFAASIILMACARVVVRRMMRRWTDQGRLARRAVLVGGGRPVADLLDSLKSDAGKSIQILGLFDDRGGERSPDEIGEYHKLGGFDDLVTFCREHAVDLLIIALPHTAEARILMLLKKLWVLPIDIRISALGSKLKLRPRAYTYIGKTPFLAVFDKPLTDWGLAVKTVEDRLLAGMILVLLSPVMLAVAMAVKFTSKGPILFKQTRYGFNNEKIGVYKFRSMYVDQCDANAVKLVTKGDPRVTKVGAFIRKTSLDELPQLFNVLKGELSIVGPRPHAMQAKADGHVYDEVVEGYFARHKVKPGITGWAQINGWRGETDTVDKIERRVEFDLQYIDNWSVFFDLYILAMTPVSLLNTKNAY